MTADTPFPYTVVDEYIRGGCSVIYRIKPKDEQLLQQSNKTFVLKTMLPDDEDEAAEKRFYMEYEFLRAYPHPNLIEVLEYLPNYKGHPAYVMEWVNGDTWQSFWQNRDPLTQPELFLLLFKQLCEVLDFIHKRNIVHRDLKPQNILIDAGNRVKLIDFGIMKVQDLTMFTNRNAFMGSAYYVAPECLSGDDVSFAADIFSLGVMLYDLFTGEKPFRGHTLAETVYQRLVNKPKPPSSLKNLPPSFDPLFERLLHLEPHKRFSSCMEAFHCFASEPLFVAKTQPPSEPAMVTNTQKMMRHHQVLLHRLFLEECQQQILKERVLYLASPSGSGKRTLIDGWLDQCDHDLKIKIDLQPTFGLNDFMDVILSALPKSSLRRPEHLKWLQLLSRAIPWLKKEVPVNSDNDQYPVQNPNLLAAFLQILEHTPERCFLAIQEADQVHPSFLKTLHQFCQFIKTTPNGRVFVVITSEKRLSELGTSLKTMAIPFPDIVTLSQYLSEQFDNARVPLEVTSYIAKNAQDNLRQFIRTTNTLKQSGLLSIKDGGLVLAALEEVETQLNLAGENIPHELNHFSQDQLHHLEWLALSPEGMDIGVLKKITQVNFDELSQSLSLAKKLDLLDFQASATQGLYWKNKKIRDFLLNALSGDQRRIRCLELAEKMAEHAKVFLEYSPPLWRILSKLYFEGGDSILASEFALKYARHCVQSGQQHEIEKFLDPFQELPSLQNNGEYWGLLALGSKQHEPQLALTYAERALHCQPSLMHALLLSLIYFDLGHTKQSKLILAKTYATAELSTLNAHFMAELISLFLATDQYKQAEEVMSHFESRPDRLNDPYSNNLWVQAKMAILEKTPVEALAFFQQNQHVLLPATRKKVLRSVFFCHLMRFEKNEALSLADEINSRPREEDSVSRASLLDHLFVHLYFQDFQNAHRLLAQWGKAIPSAPEDLPFTQTISKLLLGDVSLFQNDDLLTIMKGAHLNPTWWLPLLLSLAPPHDLHPDLVKTTVELCQNHLPFWARHQLPRLMLIQQIVLFKEQELSTYWRAALKYANTYQLVSEMLHLEMLRDYLISQGVETKNWPVVTPQPLHTKPDVIQFFRAKWF